MVLQQHLVTAEQFDEYIQRPDLGDAIYELICGSIAQKESSPFTSAMAGTILFYLVMYVREHGRIGHVTAAAGGYRIFDDCLVPDAAYISKARQPELARVGYNPNPPELAVEVISDESNAQELSNLRRKITNYLAAGTVVWAVFPFSQFIEVHAPGQPVQIIGIDGTLDGGEILPGFTLPVQDIFQT